MTPSEALKLAKDTLGSQTALALELGVTKAAVGQWKDEGRKVPAEHCPTIEKLTKGAVRCEQLRPDIDWAVLRSPSVEQEAHMDASETTPSQLDELPVVRVFQKDIDELHPTRLPENETYLTGRAAVLQVQGQVLKARG